MIFPWQIHSVDCMVTAAAIDTTTCTVLTLWLGGGVFGVLVRCQGGGWGVGHAAEWIKWIARGAQQYVLGLNDHSRFNSVSCY